MTISGIYKHFKGKEYRVFSQAIDIDTNEIYVFYQQLYSPYIYWIRPWNNFFSNVDSDGVTVSRFSKLQQTSEPFPSQLLEEIDAIHSETHIIYHLRLTSENTYVAKCTNQKSII